MTTEISEARNQETDHQGELQSLEMEVERPKARLEIFQQTNAKIAGRNKELIQHVQFANGEKTSFT